MDHHPLLRVDALTKHYGSVVALAHADFELRPGEVMALLGENGAGKSTLVKCLAGLVTPDAGTIAVGGETVELRDPARSRAAGVAVVQQELSIVGCLSVAENVVLAGAKAGVSRRRAVELARPVLAQVGLAHLDPRTPADRLSIAEQQLVEIARVLARDARVVILDEPTAALSDEDIARVARVVRSLAADGRGVIYVTHRLSEVFEICDRVTVFRNGRSQPAVSTRDLTLDSLIERMLGRKLDAMFPARAVHFGDPLLEIHELAGPGLLAPLSLTVRAGEVLGLAGQLGSGAQELLRLLSGKIVRTCGRATIAGEDVRSGGGQRRAIAAGLAYCSDDRKRDGIFGGRSVTENLTAPGLRTVSPGGVLSLRRESSMARDLADRFRVDQRRLRSPVATLSGGNQQKVALGKWLGVRPRVLLVDEPSRGVDVGARAEIYEHLRRLADDGMAVVFSSSSLAEVLGLADTVVSFYRGRVVATAAAEGLDEATLFRQVTHDPERHPVPLEEEVMAQ